jgi:hypothetical protein
MMLAGLITGGTGDALYGRCRLFTHKDLLKFTAYAHMQVAPLNFTHAHLN